MPSRVCIVAKAAAVAVAIAAVPAGIALWIAAVSAVADRCAWGG